MFNSNSVEQIWIPGTTAFARSSPGPLRTMQQGPLLQPEGYDKAETTAVMRPLRDTDSAFEPLPPESQLDEFTYDQIADQLTVGYWGYDTTLSWDVSDDNMITVDVTALDADAKYLARQALLLWTDITGIQFSEVSSDGEITFYQDGNLEAYASTSFYYFDVAGPYTIFDADVHIAQNWITTYGNTLNSYGFQTYIHEIGHALGLGHAGDYDGSADYNTDALYLNDAWSTTVMSYFDQTENTFFANQGFSRLYLGTPMNGDIVAMTDLYGLSTTTRTGNTTYGFNSNSDRDIHDATLFTDAAYTIVDSGGIDRLDYSGFTQDQLIDLSPEEFMNIGGYVGNVVIGRGTDIERAFGGSGNDTINGNGLANVLVGNGGNDILYGKGGADYLFTKDGDDTGDGGSGADVLRGNAGEDDLSGGTGDDTIKGDTDNDTLSGDAGDDTIFGGPGNDSLDGGDDADLLVGDGGRDTIFGGAGDDLIQGGFGGDYLYGQSGADRVEGNEGTDEVYGNSGDDILRGGAGDDTLDGGSGKDTLKGDDDNDTVYGGDDNDKVYGNDGNDILYGQAGKDTLYGGAGFDIFGFEDALIATNVDTIADFSVADDTIQLDLAIFTELGGTGTLSASEFATGSSASDTSDRIIYDSSTGDLFYDSDGSGAAAQVLFATLATGLSLTNADFTAVGTVSQQPLQDNAPPGFMPAVYQLPVHLVGGDALFA